MSVVATDADCQPGRGRRHAADAASRAGRLHTNHRWKVLGIGVAANASFSATFAGIPATAVFLRSGYHLSNGNLGLVLGLLGLGVALSELPWGLLTDRWGDRGVLLTGLGATAAWLLLMALFIVPSMAYVPGVAMLAACLLVTGLLGGSVNGSSGRAIMAWFHEGERGFAMSIRQTAVPLGGGLGALVLPSLASVHGFALVFGLLAALNAVSALFAWRWLHQPPEIDLPGNIAMARPVGPAPLRNVEVWRLATGIGLLCFPQVAVLTFASVFLHDFAGMGTLVVSASLAAVQTGAMVMRVWSGRYSDRHGNRRSFLRLCSVSSAAAFAALGLLVLAAATMPGSACRADAGDRGASGRCRHLGLRLAWRRLHRTRHACRRQPRRHGARSRQQLRLHRLLCGADRHSGIAAGLVVGGRLAGGFSLRADRLADFPPAGLIFCSVEGAPAASRFGSTSKKHDRTR